MTEFSFEIFCFGILLLGAIIGAIAALVIWHFVLYRPLAERFNKSWEVVKLQNPTRKKNETTS